MKTPQSYLLILILLAFGCSQKEKNELNGVWYNVDFTKGNYYYEAHVTDTGFVVINQSGLSYLSSYKLKNDTLIQYIRDSFLNRKTIDTLRFEIEQNQDSFVILNTINPKSNSKWTRIPSIKPFEFYKNQSIDSFALGLRKRYFDNYVSKFVPQNYVDYQMDYFDIDWSIKNEK